MNALPYLLDAARGAVILGAALAAMPLARRAPASARRAILASALAAVLIAPALTRALAGSTAARAAELPVVVRAVELDPIVDAPAASPAPEGAAPAAAGEAENARATALVRAPQSPAFQRAIAALWALGALLVIARLALGHARARRLVRRALVKDPHAFGDVIAAAQREVGARARVVITEDVDAPAVTGVLRPVVLMPRAALAWSEQRWRLVLLHELSHVRGRDCLVNVVAQLACAVHWFNPLAWIAARRLLRERELAADEQVLAAGAGASDYAGHLVAIAAAAQHRLAAPGGVLAMAPPRSELSARVEAIVRGGPRPRPSRARALLLALSNATLAFLVACAGPRTATQGETAEGTAPPNQSPQAQGSASPASEAQSPLAEEVAAVMGAPASRVDLTIEPALQRILDEEMARVTADWQPAAATGIILEPSTGELLAIADAKTARRALVTGSTLKPMTFAAALDTGAVRAEDKIDCKEGSYVDGALVMHDASPHGVLDVGQVLAVSSNVGTAKILDALGSERLGEYLGRFHFGSPSTVQLPDVARGDAPTLTALTRFQAATVAIGERLSATPLQMAAAYAAFANGGEFVAPTLARRVRDDAGRATWTHTPARERVVRAETARAVMAMLEGVVQSEKATGTAARVSGVRVAGKTGTAEWTTPDGKEHTYASFIGIVPADAPRYVILIGVEEPREKGPGGKVAAPAFARIAARALPIKR